MKHANRQPQEDNEDIATRETSPICTCAFLVITEHKHILMIVRSPTKYTFYLKNTVTFFKIF